MPVADLELEVQFLLVAFLHAGLHGGVGRERVCPVAVRVFGKVERALAVDGHAVFHHLVGHTVHHHVQGVAVVGVHVVEVQGTGIIGRRGRINDRRVIGAFNMHGHGLFRGRAFRVRHRNGEAVGSLFTFAQDFGPFVQRVLVGPLAVFTLDQFHLAVAAVSSGDGGHRAVHILGNE